MLALRMDLLFDSLLKDERLLRVAMQLLSNGNVGPQFAHVLLNYLVDKQLPSVQEPTSKVGGDSLTCSGRLVPTSTMLLLLLSDAVNLI